MTGNDLLQKPMLKLWPLLYYQQQIFGRWRRGREGPSGRIIQMKMILIVSPFIKVVTSIFHQFPLSLLTDE
jgi:hypothetical protein